jgi:hypothetical protein
VLLSERLSTHLLVL